MSILTSNQRTLLEAAIKQGRNLVESIASVELERLQVAAKTPPDYLNEEQKELRRRMRQHARNLGSPLVDGIQDVTLLHDELAYHLWHKMLFTRFLVENNLLMFSQDGYSIPVSMQDCKELAEAQETSPWLYAAQLAACMLPQIFVQSTPQLKVPASREHELENLIISLPSEIFHSADALGWCYQYWQTSKKEAINASGLNIGAQELAPVTQLFTEPYMVQFLLDNSLGSWFALQKIQPQAWADAQSEEDLRALAATEHLPLNYLRFTRNEQGTWQPLNGLFEDWQSDIDAINLLDPCCGSGHFLIAALRMLGHIRCALDPSMSPQEAIDRSLRLNLHALELDQRCVEIAAFSLAFTAWTFPGAEGVRPLPQLNIACVGQKPPMDKEQWMKLARNLAQRQIPAEGLLVTTDEDTPLFGSNIQAAMEKLYDLFAQADILGSLLDAQNLEADLLCANFEDIERLLNEMLARAFGEDDRDVAIQAQSMAVAARLLHRQYTLVITNVPYLALGKQCRELADWCRANYPDAKADLATVFLQRSLNWLSAAHGMSCIVLPQNWLFLKSYQKFRQHLLRHSTWRSVAKLGPKGFQTPMWDFNVMLISLSNRQPDVSALEARSLHGLDVSQPKTAKDKDAALKISPISNVSQQSQLDNPDARVTLEELSSLALLEAHTKSVVGLQTGDDPFFLQQFWEQPHKNHLIWEWLQNTPNSHDFYSGLTGIVRWEQGKGELLRRKTSYPTKGREALGKRCLAIHRMRIIKPLFYAQERFHQNLAVLIPKNPEDLGAIQSFCSSPEYNEEVRKIDQALKVTNATLVKAPFDKERWEKVAQEQYPNGLPQPYSNDPTQWVFHGHPCRSVVWDEQSKTTVCGAYRYDSTVLHVAVARLLGYRWPAELDASMELSEPSRQLVEEVAQLSAYTDSDGLVGIPAMAREREAHERLYQLLAAAYGEAWTPDTPARLIAATGSKAHSLERWLRDDFFKQHCKLFGERPFIWQVWDGLKDGFSVLVNYHKLDEKCLTTLIYSYLGDWIVLQKSYEEKGINGSGEKQMAANTLKQRLEAILQGEAPYDIFVRWKTLAQQALGWQPDLNDGVRLNIRPWLQEPSMGKRGTGVLRDKPNVKWDKDRGTDAPDSPWYPLHQGARINDHHCTLSEKHQARNAHEQL